MTDTTRLEDAPPAGVLVIPTYRLALWWARKHGESAAWRRGEVSRADTAPGGGAGRSER